MADPVLERLEALGSFLRSASSTPSFDKVRASQFEALCKVFAKASLSLQRAADINQKLGTLPWAPEQLAALTEIVVAKQIEESADAELDRRPALQDYTRLHAYMTNSQWVRLSSTTESSSVKMEIVLTHACILGCSCPTEPSSQMFTAIILLVTEGEAASRMLPSVRLSTLKAVKALHKKLVKSGIGHSSRPQVLPASSQEFKNKYPKVWAAAFADESPVECPVEAAALHKLSASVPMRASRSDATQEVPTLRVGTDHFGMQAQNFAQSMMSQMQNFQRVQEMTLAMIAGKPVSSGFPQLMFPECSTSSSSDVTPQRAALQCVQSRLQLLDGQCTPRPKMMEQTDAQPPAAEAATPTATAPPEPAKEHTEKRKLVEHPGLEQPKKKQTVEEVTAAMLRSMQAKSTAKDDAKDAPLASMPNAAKKPKGKAKAKPKAKPAKVEPIKAKPKAKSKASGLKPASSSTKPTISWERSRCQVMCRTGIVGLSNQCSAIKFDQNNKASATAAWSKAERWLQQERKRQNIS